VLLTRVSLRPEVGGRKLQFYVNFRQIKFSALEVFNLRLNLPKIKIYSSKVSIFCKNIFRQTRI